YTDQRYWSTQVSVKRHSSGVSTELTAPLPCTGSGVLADSTCPDGISGRDVGRGSGKAASIATLLTEIPSSPIAVACRASMGSASAVAAVAQLPSVGAPVFSMRGEPKSSSPAATTTAVPHSAANAASRRWLITSSLPVLSEAPPSPMLHTQ